MRRGRRVTAPRRGSAHPPFPGRAPGPAPRLRASGLRGRGRSGAGRAPCYKPKWLPRGGSPARASAGTAAPPAGPRPGTGPGTRRPARPRGPRGPRSPGQRCPRTPRAARPPEPAGPVPDRPRPPYLELGPLHLPVRPLHLEASPLVLDVVQDPRDGVVLGPGQLGGARRLLTGRGRGALGLGLLPSSSAASSPHAAPTRLQVHVSTRLRRRLLRSRGGRHPTASSGSRVLVHCLRGALLLVPRRGPGAGAGEGASGADWGGEEGAGRAGGLRRAGPGVSAARSRRQPPLQPRGPPTLAPGRAGSERRLPGNRGLASAAASRGPTRLRRREVSAAPGGSGTGPGPAATSCGGTASPAPAPGRSVSGLAVWGSAGRFPSAPGDSRKWWRGSPRDSGAPNALGRVGGNAARPGPAS